MKFFSALVFCQLASMQAGNGAIKLNTDIARPIYLRPETTSGYKLTYFNG